MIKKFKKNVENFICEKCGSDVVGDGFTNHCSGCLWSKHVDLNPGDRACLCKGLMKPIAVMGSPASDLIHRCEICKFEKKNKLSKKDNFEKIIEIAENRV